MDPLLNVFDGDAFSMTNLVQSINKIPFVPGRIGQLGIFDEVGVPTTSVAIEEQYGQLSLVDPSPRGGPGETRPKNPRKARLIRIPHIELDDHIMADEVLGVREFGQNSGMRTLDSFMRTRMSLFTGNLDATMEYQRVGALTGTVLDKSGNTLYNLFNEFNVAQPTALNFSLSNATADPRVVAAQAKREMARNLGGTTFTGIYALCGDAFWDALITHPLVKLTYQFQDGAKLRQGIAYETLQYGGVTFENYMGYIAPIDGGASDGSDAVPFIPTNECRMFPVGVPNLFKTFFAPADYMETVNTIGLPRYAKTIVMDNGKGARLEMQTNPLHLCMRPRVLLRGTMS